MPRLTLADVQLARRHAHGIYGDVLEQPCDTDALTFSLWVTLTYHLVCSNGWPPDELLSELALHAHKASTKGEA